MTAKKSTRRKNQPTSSLETSVVKEVRFGKVYISASFNNTLITITDEAGNSLMWGSAGSSGFKGTRKSTPFAATTAVGKMLKEAKEELGLREVEVYVKGPGPGRDAALRAIRAAGLKIALIADITPIPHNGPRQKKKRRV
jgi:small subunit ribosomal protein S11